jgi:hypothetical protein
MGELRLRSAQSGEWSVLRSMFFFVTKGSQSFDLHEIPTPVFGTDYSHFSDAASVNQIVKKFSAFYVKQMYITVFTISHHYTLPQSG